MATILTLRFKRSQSSDVADNSVAVATLTNKVAISVKVETFNVAQMRNLSTAHLGGLFSLFLKSPLFIYWAFTSIMYGVNPKNGVK